MDAYAEALGLSAPRTPGNSGSIPGQSRVNSGSVAPQAGVTGAFVGNPDNVAMAIGEIADPQERANALAAFEAQMRAGGGSLKPARDPYAEALGIGASGQPVKPVNLPPLIPEPPKVSDARNPQTTNPGASVRPVLANQVTGIGANIVGGYRGLATLLSGGTLDDAANNVRDYVESHTYTPPKGTVGAQAVESFSSPSNPISYIPQAADYLGGKVTDVTGSPALGAAVNAGVNAVPLALGLRGRPGTTAEVGPNRPGTGVYRPLGGEPSTILPAPGEPAPVVPQAVPQQGAPVQSPIPPAPRPPGSPPAPAGAPPSANPAYKPFPTPVEVKVPAPIPKTPEAVQQVAATAPETLFPETPTVAPQGKFTPQEQVARARILESVGIDPSQLRKSAISGDAIGGSTDFQTAKLDSQAGRTMRAIIEGEKQALTTHADSLVRQTGGTHGVDQSNLYARGGTIVSSLESLKDWYDSRIRQLYQVADERSQGVPTTLERFRQVLGDDSEMTNSERVHLRDAVNAYARKLNILKEDGSVFSNGQQAETMRKYLNENWSPQNGRWVGKLKDALDEDIMQSAGEDVYGEARALRAQRGATLDNPKGIAKLMDSSGPSENGINRLVAVEKVPDFVTGMPVDQFTHVVETLKNAPPEVQGAAQAALKEIKAQFANKVKAVGSSQQGQWNAKGVTKYLQDNAARMSRVFAPEELQAFRNLNDAGHIVAKDQSYPGAAVQAHNLITQGTMHALPTAGAAAGGFIGGPAGAAVGAAAGRMAAGAVDNAVTMRAVKKRTTKLSDLLGAGK